MRWEKSRESKIFRALHRNLPPNGSIGFLVKHWYWNILFNFLEYQELAKGLQRNNVALNDLLYKLNKIWHQKRNQSKFHLNPSSTWSSNQVEGQTRVGNGWPEAEYQLFVQVNRMHFVTNPEQIRTIYWTPLYPPCSHCPKRFFPRVSCGLLVAVETSQQRKQGIAKKFLRLPCLAKILLSKERHGWPENWALLRTKWQNRLRE